MYVRMDIKIWLQLGISQEWARDQSVVSEGSFIYQSRMCQRPVMDAVSTLTACIILYMKLCNTSFLIFYALLLKVIVFEWTLFLTSLSKVFSIDLTIFAKNFIIKFEGFWILQLFFVDRFWSEQHYYNENDTV